MTTNNTLVHEYLIPLIANIDFNECDNPTAMKTVICKLLTIAKKSMKNEKEPNDMSVLTDVDFSSSSAKVMTTTNSIKKTVSIKSDDSDEEIKDTKKMNMKKSNKKDIKKDDKKDIKKDVKKDDKKNVKKDDKKKDIKKNDKKSVVDISADEDEDENEDNKSDIETKEKETKKIVRTPGKSTDEDDKDNEDDEDDEDNEDDEDDEDNKDSDIEDAISDDD
tara:strand:+ start:4992 stop:5651 length:660 start_codon:yes stop_codon:yes gene_type:complete